MQISLNLINLCEIKWFVDPDRSDILHSRACIRNYATRAAQLTTDLFPYNEALCMHYETMTKTKKFVDPETKT